MRRTGSAIAAAVLCTALAAAQTNTNAPRAFSALQSIVLYTTSDNSTDSERVVIEEIVPATGAQLASTTLPYASATDPSQSATVSVQGGGSLFLPESMLSLSYDGRSLLLSGYGAPEGTESALLQTVVRRTAAVGATLAIRIIANIMFADVREPIYTAAYEAGAGVFTSYRDSNVLWTPPAGATALSGSSGAPVSVVFTSNASLATGLAFADAGGATLLMAGVSDDLDLPGVFRIGEPGAARNMSAGRQLPLTHLPGTDAPFLVTPPVGAPYIMPAQAEGVLVQDYVSSVSSAIGVRGRRTYMCDNRPVAFGGGVLVFDAPVAGGPARRTHTIYSPASPAGCAQLTGRYEGPHLMLYFLSATLGAIDGFADPSSPSSGPSAPPPVSAVYAYNASSSMVRTVVRAPAGRIIRSIALPPCDTTLVPACPVRASASTDGLWAVPAPPPVPASEWMPVPLPAVPAATPSPSASPSSKPAAGNGSWATPTPSPSPSAKASSGSNSGSGSGNSTSPYGSASPTMTAGPGSLPSVSSSGKPAYAASRSGSASASGTASATATALPAREASASSSASPAPARESATASGKPALPSVSAAQTPKAPADSPTSPTQTPKAPAGGDGSVSATPAPVRGESPSNTPTGVPTGGDASASATPKQQEPSASSSAKQRLPSASFTQKPTRAATTPSASMSAKFISLRSPSAAPSRYPSRSPLAPSTLVTTANGVISIALASNASSPAAAAGAAAAATNGPAATGGAAPPPTVGQSLANTATLCRIRDNIAWMTGLAPANITVSSLIEWRSDSALGVAPVLIRVQPPADAAGCVSFPRPSASAKPPARPSAAASPSAAPSGKPDGSAASASSTPAAKAADVATASQSGKPSADPLPPRAALRRLQQQQQQDASAAASSFTEEPITPEQAAALGDSGSGAAGSTSIAFELRQQADGVGAVAGVEADLAAAVSSLQAAFAAPAEAAPDAVTDVLAAVSAAAGVPASALMASAPAASATMQTDVAQAGAPAATPAAAPSSGASVGAVMGGLVGSALVIGALLFVGQRVYRRRQAVGRMKRGASRLTVVSMEPPQALRHGGGASGPNISPKGSATGAGLMGGADATHDVTLPGGTAVMTNPLAAGGGSMSPAAPRRSGVSDHGMLVLGGALPGAAAAETRASSRGAAAAAFAPQAVRGKRASAVVRSTGSTV